MVSSGAENAATADGEGSAVELATEKLAEAKLNDGHEGLFAQNDGSNRSVVLPGTDNSQWRTSAVRRRFHRCVLFPKHGLRNGQ